MEATSSLFVVREERKGEERREERDLTEIFIFP
jgi:hypothetical protein